MENYDKTADVQISVVFGTGQHAALRRVFWKINFQAFK